LRALPAKPQWYVDPNLRDAGGASSAVTTLPQGSMMQR
jgi:hypothetical protein